MNRRFNLSLSEDNITSKFAIEMLESKGRKKAQYVSDAIYFYENQNGDIQIKKPQPVHKQENISDKTKKALCDNLDVFENM